MPKLHPREEIVRAAQSDLLEFMLKWSRAHDLTAIEETQLLLSQVDMTLKYALREERHPDEPDRPAGLE